MHNLSDLLSAGAIKDAASKLKRDLIEKALADESKVEYAKGLALLRIVELLEDQQKQATAHTLAAVLLSEAEAKQRDLALDRVADKIAKALESRVASASGLSDSDIDFDFIVKRVADHLGPLNNGLHIIDGKGVTAHAEAIAEAILGSQR